VNRVRVRGNASERPRAHGSTPPWTLALRLPQTDAGRALLVLFLLLVTYGYFFPRLSNWESNSRMDLVYALGDQATVRIDDYHLNTEDKAFFESHYYSEKSIGPSVTALPFYVAFRGLVQLPPLAGLAYGEGGLGSLPSVEEVYAQHELPEPGTPGAGHPPVYHAMAVTFSTFFSVALMSAALGVVVYLMTSRLSASPGSAVAAALAFGLATPALAYSNELYQHQAGSFGAFVGTFLLWRVIEEGASKRLLWVVGALFGFAAASEYVLAPILAGILAWAIVRLRSPRQLWRVVAGATPWILATTAYNLAAFGTPVPVGYRYSIFGIPAGSLFGLVPPSWDSVFGITFSPYRGLFFVSPFLLGAPIGLFLMMRRDRTRQLAVMLTFIILAFFVYNACYWVWDGGGAIGPRFLVPALPFLCLPIGFVFAAAKRVWQRSVVSVLVLLSVAAIWVQFLAGDNFPPDSVSRPISDYALPLLRRGEVRFNVGNLLGLQGLVTLAPLAVLLGATVLIVPSVERLWLRRRPARTV
jgi:hypothetical protein